MSKIYSERLLVAGDAAGHTNPVTGGGIPVALYDGILSGEICVEAIKKGRFDAGFLSRYQRIWDKSRFNRAWIKGFKLKACLNSQAYRSNMESVFSRIGFKTINGRKELVEISRSKGLSIKDIMFLYKFGATMFDDIVDYAM